MVLLLDATFSVSEVVERILAVADDTPITMTEFDNYKFIVANLPYEPPPAWLDKAVHLGDYIDYELTQRDALRSGLAAVSKGEVDQAIERMKEALAEKGGLDKALAQRGLNLEDARDFIAKFIGVLKYVEIRFRPLATPSEDELTSYISKAGKDPATLSNAQKEAAKEGLEKIKFKKIYDEYLNTLRERATININEP